MLGAIHSNCMPWSNSQCNVIKTRLSGGTTQLMNKLLKHKSNKSRAAGPLRSCWKEYHLVAVVPPCRLLWPPQACLSGRWPHQTVPWKNRDLGSGQTAPGVQFLCLNIAFQASPYIIEAVTGLLYGRAEIHWDSLFLCRLPRFDVSSDSAARRTSLRFIVSFRLYTAEHV